MNLYELYPRNSSDLKGLVRTNNLECEVKTSKGRVNDNRNASPQTLVTSEAVVHVCTSNDDNSYYTFSFPGYYYQISNYTFQTGEKWIENGLYPVHWKVEGYTGNKWVKLNEVDHPDPGMNEKKTQTFDVITSKWFKQIKFTHMGLAYSGNGYEFCLYKVDLFGMLIKNNIYNTLVKKTISNKIDYSFFTPITFIFLIV